MVALSILKSNSTWFPVASNLSSDSLSAGWGQLVAGSSLKYVHLLVFAL